MDPRVRKILDGGPYEIKEKPDELMKKAVVRDKKTYVTGRKDEATLITEQADEFYKDIATFETEEFVDENGNTPIRTKVWIRQLEREIYELMMKGWSNKMITDYLQDQKGYGSKNGAKFIINKVNNSMCMRIDADIELLKAKYAEMYSNLYLKALQDNDIKTANSVLDSLVKLQGLITNKVESKVENTFKVEF